MSRGEKDMSNITDIIERYLKQVLQSKNQNMIEIKRSEIADQFQCVPSQINYVINTRFTEEKGYIIESKRGGGGYIRIIRIEHQEQSDLLDAIIKLIQPTVTQQASVDIVERLLEKEVITEREAKLMVSVIDINIISVPLPIRDEFRSRMMTAMLTTLKYTSK